MTRAVQPRVHASPDNPIAPHTMSAMAEPGTAQHAPRQHVVVVGADTTTVRLAEELVRSGEQLVVIAHGENSRGAIADIEALGCQMIIASQIREAELRVAGVERARAAVVLGDDDVLALRLGLMIDELHRAYGSSSR